MRRLLVIGASAFLLACPGFGDDEPLNVPENPTYDPHVKAILDAHCIDCHVDPPQNNAPGGIRLDVYESDASNVGAGDFGCDIETRAVDQNPSQMPPAPRAALNAAEAETIRRWTAQGRKKISSDAPLPACP